MNSDLAIIKNLCEGLAGVKTATLRAIETPYADRAGALAAFLAFSGEGWLCTAESKEVYLLPVDHPAETEYPLHGELANGTRTLHLRQDGAGGWVLTILEEVANEASVCFETELAAYDSGLGMLRYQVCHEPVHPGIPDTLPALSELRPARARFLGFRPAS